MIYFHFFVNVFRKCFGDVFSYNFGDAHVRSSSYHRVCDEDSYDLLLDLVHVYYFFNHGFDGFFYGGVEISWGKILSF